MRYLSVYKTAERNEPPTPEMMASMGRLVEEMTRAGALVTTGGCLPSALGFRARRTNGKVTTLDGPFTESKEIIGGFAILDVESKEEAIEWTKRFLALVGDGESEVRQLYEDMGSRG